MAQSEHEVRTFESKAWIPPKLIIAASIAVLAVIFILQNIEKAQISFLFWDLSFPLWILMALLLAAGFALGLLFPRFRQWRSSRAGEPPPP